MIHENYNVYDLQKSLDFYKEALGLEEKRRKESADGSFIIVYVGNDETDFELELTWMRDMDRPYNLGDCEFQSCQFQFRILKERMQNTKKWDASVLKMKRWESTLSKIRMDTGWRSFRRNKEKDKNRVPIFLLNSNKLGYSIFYRMIYDTVFSGSAVNRLVNRGMTGLKLSRFHTATRISGSLL